MFAINSAFQAYPFIQKKNELSSHRAIVNAFTLFFDVGIIVFTAITTLGLVKIFPKDFLTNKRIITLQATAFTVASLDLLTLIPLCYSLSANKKDPKIDQVNVDHVQREIAQENIDNVQWEIPQENIADYKTQFEKGFIDIYCIFFSNDSVKTIYRLSPLNHQALDFYQRKTNAYDDAVSSPEFENNNNIEAIGRKAAYRDLFFYIYKKNSNINVEAEYLQQQFDILYQATYDELFEPCKIHWDNEAQSDNPNDFYYYRLFVEGMALKICEGAKQIALQPQRG